MKKYIRSDTILCMSNIRGDHVKHPKPLKFSFYFSSGSGVTHSIRVKPMFNPQKLRASLTGTLKLSDDWAYIPGPDDSNVSNKDIKAMKDFFKQHIVLFCAVWDEQIDDTDLSDYFTGEIEFDELLKCLDFYPDYSDELDTIHDVKDLENFCRANNLVNLYGN